MKAFVQLSNDFLVSASSLDIIIKVWDLKSGALIQSISSGHSDWIRSWSVYSDKGILASTSNDHAIKIWKLK